MALPQIAPYPLPDTVLASRAPWRPEADRMALLIHDMQRYFCAPYAAEAAPLAEIVPNIAALAAAARAAGVPVFYTAQQGNQFRPDRGLQADLWGPGMRAEAAMKRSCRRWHRNPAITVWSSIATALSSDRTSKP